MMFTTFVPSSWRHTTIVLLILSIILCSQLTTARPEIMHTKKYKVIRMKAKTDSDVHTIQDLQHTYNLDAWRKIKRVNMTGDYLVSPKHINDVQQKLTDSNIDHEVIIDDAESFLRENDPLHHRTRSRRSTSHNNFRHQFLTYSEIMNFLRHVRDTATSANVALGTIGRSFEGRATPYVKITSRNNSNPKGTIFIDGGVHSREWIAPAMTIEIIHRLAYNKENDSSVQALLDKFDWIIVPLVNPDGYAYTFVPGLLSRLWRKSRASIYSNHPECYGVDLNRNFGYQWHDSPLYGGSSNPCTGTFSGPRSFSEPETQNMRTLLLHYKDKIQGYLSFHSFGQYFLYPWSYSSDADLEDEDDLYQVASAFVDTMLAKDYQYSLGTAAKTLYPAAGASDDYVRGTVGVKYAYTVELPPRESSRYGFELPESDIQSIVSDTWEGLKAFALRLHGHSNQTANFRDTWNSSNNANYGNQAETNSRLNNDIDTTDVRTSNLVVNLASDDGFLIHPVQRRSRTPRQPYAVGNQNRNNRDSWVFLPSRNSNSLRRVDRQSRARRVSIGR